LRANSNYASNEYFMPVMGLIFLRRVGGGYIFVHRLLMEHFAEIYVEEKNLH
jgi:hypothetical protein